MDVTDIRELCARTGAKSFGGGLLCEDRPASREVKKPCLKAGDRCPLPTACLLWKQH
jgi:hypothetical protein